VLTGTPGAERVMTEGSPYALHFVRDNAHPCTRAADQYPVIESALRHGLCYGKPDIRIVNRAGAVATEILVRMAQLGEQFHYTLLQIESRVVTANGNLHRFPLNGYSLIRILMLVFTLTGGTRIRRAGLRLAGQQETTPTA
jgi:hypothetical protein